MGKSHQRRKETSFPSLPFPSPFLTIGGRADAGAALCSLPPSVDSAIRAQSDSDARRTPETELLPPPELGVAKKRKFTSTVIFSQLVSSFVKVSQCWISNYHKIWLSRSRKYLHLQEVMHKA